MNAEQQLVIYRLAHENNLKLGSFLKRLQEVFHIDTSAYPRDKDGSIMYPNGFVGLDIEMPVEHEMTIHKAAESSGLSTNDYITKILDEKIAEVRKSHPDAFKDLDDKN